MSNRRFASGHYIPTTDSIVRKIAMYMPCRLVAALLAAVLPCLVCLPAQAADPAAIAKLRASAPGDFLKQPLELVVVYPAGGGMDVTARLLAKYLERATGQRVIVTNKTGGGGLVGHQWLTKQAKPDGTTIGIVSNNVWTDSILRAEGRWSYKDLDPLAFINYDPLVWIVANDGMFRDIGLADIVKAVQQRPGSVKVAMTPGGTSEFLAQDFERAAKGALIKVPFQGSGTSLTALLGKNVDISYGFMPDFKGQMDAGLVRPVGVASSARVARLPQVPTFNEILGTDVVVYQAWRFVAVPRGVPQERQAWLESAFKLVLGDPEVLAEFERSGSIVDARLATRERVAEELERLANIERRQLLASGRLK